MSDSASVSKSGPSDATTGPPGITTDVVGGAGRSAATFGVTGTIGAATGCPVGAATGCPVGAATGCPVGAATGCPVGAATGCPVGAAVGAATGCPDGAAGAATGGVCIVPMLDITPDGAAGAAGGATVAVTVGVAAVGPGTTDSSIFSAVV